MGKNHGKVYLHVGNSGATFTVKDNGHGPEIGVHTSSHGNLVLNLRIMTDAAGLRAVGEMLLKAAEHEGYSEPHTAAARFLEKTGSYGDDGGGEDPAMEKGPMAKAAIT